MKGRARCDSRRLARVFAAGTESAVSAVWKLTLRANRNLSGTTKFTLAHTPARELGLRPRRRASRRNLSQVTAGTEYGRAPRPTGTPRGLVAHE